MKGKFITFEGIEGCGKSTQIELLKNYLKKEKNLERVLTREPGGTVLSEKIRELLLSKEYGCMLPETEALLFAASRSQHTGELIIPSLENETWVLCDRYFDSTMAYQGAARDLNMNDLRMITNFATYGLTPDTTFLFDLSVETAFSRIRGKRDLDRMECESKKFHEDVRKGFLNLAKENPDRFKVFDGTKDINSIYTEMVEFINKRYF
jgi:dTMP kinase